MPIIVHSPYSGRPIKIRDQDVGRALRDEEGRIFYAVPRRDGNGYYGAPTRHGSEKDEQRYDDLLAKGEQARAVGAAASAAQIHDAMGQRRGGLRRVILLIVLLAVLAMLGYVVWLLFGDELADRFDVDGPAPLSPPELPVPDAAPQLPSPAPPQPQAAAAPFSVIEKPPGVTSISYAVNREEPRVQADPLKPLKPLRLAQSVPEADPAPEYTTTPSGLRYRIVEAGRGRTATAGSYVLIHYSARPSPDGPIVDTSHTDDPATDKPIGFVLWSGRVIRGWDIGIAGMKIGEKRQLIVPPDLITAAAESPDAPTPEPSPGAGLVFDIELVDVLPGVLHEITRVGTVGGQIAQPGDVVEVRYVGWVDGESEPFDDARNRPEPLRFEVGAGDVIRGWDLGVVGMKEGELRTLVIPPYLAYGQRGIEGLIPPGATLRYEIELLRVVPPAPR